MKFVLLLCLAVAASASLAPFYDAGEHGVKGQYIVMLEKSVSVEASVDRFLTDATRLNLIANIKRRFPLLNGFVTQVDFEGKGLQLLRSMPGVRYVEEEEIVFADEIKSWGLDRIDQRDVSLDEQMVLDDYGSGQTVYVIDSGINPEHVDFGGRAEAGYDFVDNDESAIDCNGHGTHCAGTVAGTEYGVARLATVIGLRTLDCSGSGMKSSSIAALEWIISDGKIPSVASMSLGGSVSTAQNEAVAKAFAAGVVVVVSAGNNDGDACDKSPASAPEAITVGSTDITDTRSSFSNYGKCVDLFAPGSSIVSLDYRTNTGYTTKSGTSMSCPHVAGIAAVLLQNLKTAEEVSTKITNNATKGKVIDAKLRSPNLLAYCD